MYIGFFIANCQLSIRLFFRLPARLSLHMEQLPLVGFSWYFVFHIRENVQNIQD